MHASLWSILQFNFAVIFLIRNTTMLIVQPAYCLGQVFIFIQQPDKVNQNFSPVL